MKKKFNIIEAAIKYKQITLLITAVLMIYGIYSLVVMPRQEFPEFTIRQGVIVAAMPGATSEEMENQIAQPIEDYLFTFKEVNKKKTYSQSKDGITYFFVEINDNVKNPPDFWAKIKHGLNVLKAKLPKDLYDIFVNDDFGNTSAMLISLESDTKSYKELNDIMKGLEAHLRQNEAVSKLNRVGMQNEVINIYLQPEKMSYYGVKPMMIMMSFQSDGAITYAGKIKDNTIEMPVHFSSKFKNIEDISKQIIFNDPLTGAVVRVKDIAYVKREMKEPDSYITNNQTKCLILSIEMMVGNNIVDFGNQVKEVIDNYEKELPGDVKITRIVNQAEIV
ncbi:MAG TPA: efflux RND transporter permease subunit, partial [Candidatus Kapabacteria bacterium]|nr:efflux RND transporter permease subunit [Candidatus Kapabacteria bacterium]